jgi:membrane-associated phospholipid phosphatase
MDMTASMTKTIQVTFFFTALFCLCFHFHSVAETGENENKKNHTKPSQTVSVSPTLDYVYSRPKAFNFITAVPKDIVDVGKISFKKENIPLVAFILAETAMLVPADQEIIYGVKRIGSTFKIPPTSHQHTVFDLDIKVKGKEINFPFGFPDDVNSSMYFLGDGLTHTAIIIGFVGYGFAAKNYRALQTGSQIAETMIASGLVVQTLKHLTGRESPFVATEPGGKWTVFPNQKMYANNVPHYDAYPSGHLTTAVGTVTVIAENYPEYRLIRPVGYTLCGLLAFSMMNNGVHWISDYPLAIALGYTFGKVAASHGKKEIKKDPPKEHAFSKSHLGKPSVYPSSIGGIPACSFRWSF